MTEGVVSNLRGGSLCCESILIGQGALRGGAFFDIICNCCLIGVRGVAKLFGGLFFCFLFFLSSFFVLFIFGWKSFKS